MAPSHSLRRSSAVGAIAMCAAGVYVCGCGFAIFSSTHLTSSRTPATLAGNDISAFDRVAALRLSEHRRPTAAPRHALANFEKQAISPGFDLTGKVVLVTGASRGIGAAVAKKLVEAGATVVGTATSDSGAEAISARFDGEFKGKGMKLNVRDPADVESVFKAITKEYGSPDILVNNAGITEDNLMMRMKDTQWDSVIDANLNSVFRCTKLALKGMMKKKWGRVISISSVVGSMGNAGQANYAASKAGVSGFSRALAHEVASRGITVNTVAPGFIATDMTDGLKEEWKTKLLESVPVGRLGTADEIADAVLFLAAPSSAYITGQNLHVNGGMYM